jgi:transmembrane sensor
MKKNEIPPPDMIRRFLTGTCTDTERREVMDWYASHETAEDPLDLLTLQEKNDLQQQVLSKVQERTGQTAAIVPIRSRRFRWLPYAVISGAAAAALLLFLFRTTSQMPIHPVSQEIISNPSAVISRHQLADGSTIWLKPKASITVQKGFAVSHRELQLTGEVYFEVAPNALPFRVASRYLVTEVLGTSFSMNESGGRGEVVVLSGKVAVHRGNKATVLLPAQKIVYREAQQSWQLDSLNSKDPSIWERCELNFNNANVRQISETLNKRFAVRITVADSTIAHYTLKADFTGMNLPAILEMLGKALNISYSMQGEEILLQKNIRTM